MGDEISSAAEIDTYVALFAKYGEDVVHAEAARFEHRKVDEQIVRVILFRHKRRYAGCARSCIRIEIERRVHHVAHKKAYGGDVIPA